MPKYCPSCGKQTLYETDDFDCDAGDKYVCYSCGFAMWMSESEALYYTCERGSVKAFQPVKSEVEVMLESAYASMVSQVFNRSFFADKWSEDAAVYRGEKIKFRKYEPLI